MQRLVSLGGVIGAPSRITGTLAGWCLLQTNTLTYYTQSKHVRLNKCKMWGIEPHLQPFPDPHCHYANLAFRLLSLLKEIFHARLPEYANVFIGYQAKVLV